MIMPPPTTSLAFVENNKQITNAFDFDLNLSEPIFVLKGI